MIGDPVESLTPLGDIKGAKPLYGYCAMCGAVRYRCESGIRCGSGCWQTPRPDEPRVLITPPPLVPEVIGKPYSVRQQDAPPHRPGIDKPYRATSYLVEELRKAADLLLEAARHIEMEARP